MSLVSINFTASPTSASVTRFVQDGCTISEYLQEVEGINSFKDITVEVDGAPTDLDNDLEDGMNITIAQKKTDSGQGLN